MDVEAIRTGLLTDGDRQARVAWHLKQRNERLDNDLRALMATPGGRRVVFWLVDELAGLSGDRGHDDFSLAVDKGRRSVGRDLMRRVQQVAPEDWVSGLTESYADRQERDFETR